MSPTLINTRNDPYNFRYDDPKTVDRIRESTARMRHQNISMNPDATYQNQIAQFEGKGLARMQSLDQAFGGVADRKNFKAQYPTSAIHKLATGKSLSIIERNPRNETMEIVDRIGHSLPKKINEIRFESHHYHRDNTETINNSNGANGRSQFIQSPGLPGFNSKH